MGLVQIDAQKYKENNFSDQCLKKNSMKAAKVLQSTYWHAGAHIGVYAYILKHYKK